MNTTDLASHLQLSPRAILMTGSLSERTKTSEGGTISCFTPHHAREGSPAVAFEGDEPAPVHMDGACIECALAEKAPLEAAARSYARTLNLVHLIFGSQGGCPTNNELKCLREAGQILRANVGRPIHLAALPILVAGKYGVAVGRLYVLGLFNAEGQCLFLNPAANGQLLKAEYPENQKIRSLVDQAPVQAQAPAPAPGLPAWYTATADTLAVALKLRGSKLHEAVLNTRASIVAKEQKITPKAALAAATAEYDEAKAALKDQAASTASKTVPAQAPAPAQARKSLLTARV